VRFEMSGDVHLANARARLGLEGFADVLERPGTGARPLLVVPAQRREDAARALRIVLGEDPDAEMLV